jgi:hypothetical protein
MMDKYNFHSKVINSVRWKCKQRGCNGTIYNNDIDCVQLEKIHNHKRKKKFNEFR